MRKRDYKAYSSWYNMKDRCNNPNNPKAHLYSQKGITYDPKWETFEGFLKDMGERPEETSLDRIDGNKGYYKENCRWADSHTQATNTKRNRGCVYDTSKYRPNCKLTKPFKAEITFNKKHYGKLFTTVEEANLWIKEITDGT